jgi:hypothetical protein
MTKLDKLEREQERARMRVAEYQARLKELDGAIVAAENVQIVEAIRALKLTRAELREFMRSGKLPKELPGADAMPAGRYLKKPEVKSAVSGVGEKLKVAATPNLKDAESEDKKDEN